MNSEKMISLEIDDIPVKVPDGTTILNAAENIGIQIPTLCYLKDLAPSGSCRLCVVEIGKKDETTKLVPSCIEPCVEGMKVQTRSPLVVESRKFVLDLLLSRHLNSCFSCDRAGECKKRLISYCNYDKNCFTCVKFDECDLRKYCLEYEVYSSSEPDSIEERPLEDIGGIFIHDPNRCILCRRCQRICESLQGCDIMSVLGRGIDISIGMPAESCCDITICETCGACIEVCPTGALSEKDKSPI